MMWYTTTINNMPAIMFFDGKNRVCFPIEENHYGWKDKYLAWLADGNTPEEWNGE